MTVDDDDCGGRVNVAVDMFKTRGSIVVEVVVPLVVDAVVVIMLVLRGVGAICCSSCR